jgi:hypothetical protein
MHKINKILIAAILASGEALAHTGHSAAALHFHEWDYALLTAAVVTAAVVIRRIKSKAKVTANAKAKAKT